MSYRLIDANAIQIEFPKVNELPCIYVDLPNGLDNSYHFISTDGINTTHEQIGYEKGYRDGYASAIKAEPKHGKWIVDVKRYGNEDPHCSECSAILEGDQWYWRNNNYCYHCGARMDGEENE